MEILNNEDFEICSKCGGKCCKHMPGSYYPSDFKSEQLTKEGILDLIKNHKVSMDCYEDEIVQPFLRPRINTDKCYGFWSFGGVCLHLTPAGCELPFEERPFECRSLDPHTCGSAKSNGKKDGADAWEPYAHILREIINEMNLSLNCNSYNNYKSEPKVLEEVAEWRKKYPGLDIDEMGPMMDVFDKLVDLFGGMK